MKKTIIVLLTVMLNIISLLGQSRTEIYDYFMVPKEFEYNYTDANGYTSPRKFTVKSVILNFKNDELTGFTLKSDGKAQASFKVYKWVNNTPQMKYFFIDENFAVSIVDWTAIEDGLSITFRYNGYVTFGAYFKKRLTAEEKKLREEQERARIAKEKADSIAAVEKYKADSIAAVGRIKEYVVKIDSSNIKTAVRDYEYKNYKKNARVLRRELWRINQSNLPIFSSYIENSHDVTLSIDSVAIEVVRIDEPVKYSGAKYVFDGTTYAVQDGGFICEAKIKSRLFAGYSDGIIMQWKKGLVTYIGADTSEEIDKSQIPLIISSELEKLVNTNGKYRVEYVFVDNIILSLTITKGKKVIYLQNYDDNGHLQKSGTLLTDPK